MIQQSNKKMNLQASLAVLASYVLFLSACSNQQAVPQSEAMLKTSSDQIIGGEVVEQGSWLSKTVVALYSKAGALCTGVLVDRNVILTAAHCVVNEERDPVSGIEHKIPTKPQEIVAIFTRNIDFCSQNAIPALGSTCKMARVEEIIVHPAYFQEKSEVAGDVALIRIQGQAPAEYIPSTLTSQFIDPRQFSYTAAGFGKNIGYKVEENGPRELRTVVLTGISDALYAQLGAFLKAMVLKRYEENGMQETPQYAELLKVPAPAVAQYFFPTAQDSETIPVDNSQGKGICAGDSGGAAFAQKADGSFIVTGVASTVGNPVGDEPCAMVGNYMSVAFHKEWLKLNFQRIRSIASTKTEIFEAVAN